MTKKITETQSIKKLIDGIDGMDALIKLTELVLPGVYAPGKLAEMKVEMEELKGRAAILHYPDTFNSLFLMRGWVAYESMNLQVMEDAIFAGREGRLDDAELILMDYYNEENLNLLFWRLDGHREFRRRTRLLKLAREDYLAGRYHACIPLILMLSDGIVSDISKHVGLFAERTDVIVDDAIAAHRSGLSSLLRIIGASRTVTTEDEVTVPYRHGIVHGRDLGYDTKLAAAKAWGLLFALRDWAGSVEEAKNRKPDEPELTLAESIARYVKTKVTSARIEAWRPGASSVPANGAGPGEIDVLSNGSPEREAGAFLVNWMNGRYGPLSQQLVDFAGGHPGRKAGDARKYFGPYKLCDFSIVAVEDEAAAISKIRVKLKWKHQEVADDTEIAVRLIYIDDTGSPLLRGEVGGSWRIFQSSFSALIKRKTHN